MFSRFFLRNITSSVFTPSKIAGLTLRNRIIRAGCFEGMCQGTIPSQLLIDHHREVAKGGVSMTTVAYCGVSKESLSFGHEMWMRDEILPNLKLLTDGVHEEGANASIQLGHCGFFAKPSVIGQKPIGASKKFCLFRLSRCRSMTEKDMNRVKNDFCESALLAKKAGFDVIELHSGHGYLLSQFLSPWTNKRTDDYGGSLQNRLRFPLSVLSSLRETMGDDFPILVKMNVEDGFNRGLHVDEAKIVAKEYENAGASALVLSAGFTSKTPLYMLRGNVPKKEFMKSESNLLTKMGLFFFGSLFVQNYSFTPMFLLEDSKKLRENINIPLISIGGVWTLYDMEHVLKEGFDFIQIGRPTIKNPNFVNDLASGKITGSDCDFCNRCVGSINTAPVKCFCNDN